MKKFLFIALLAMCAGKVSFGQNVSPVVNEYYSNYSRQGLITGNVVQTGYQSVNYIVTTGGVGSLPPGVHVTGIYVNYSATGYNSDDDRSGIDGFDDPNGTGSIDQESPTLDLFSFDWSKYSHVQCEFYVQFNDNTYDDIVWDYYNPY